MHTTYENTRNTKLFSVVILEAGIMDDFNFQFWGDDFNFQFFNTVMDLYSPKFLTAYIAFVVRKSKLLFLSTP